jgi:hypothetical protein
MYKERSYYSLIKKKLISKNALLSRLSAVMIQEIVHLYFYMFKVNYRTQKWIKLDKDLYIRIYRNKKKSKK